jgi:DNA-binding MarR family transcriptional regulator
MGELHTQFDSVFFERTRLSIMTIVQQRSAISFTALKDLLELSDGALFSHVGKLLDAGYLSRRKEVAGDTVQTVYSLTQQGRSAYGQYLAFLERLLEQQKDGEKNE